MACSSPPDTEEPPAALADVSEASCGAFRMLYVLRKSCAAVCFEAVFHWTCRRPGPEHACACTAVTDETGGYYIGQNHCCLVVVSSMYVDHHQACSSDVGSMEVLTWRCHPDVRPYMTVSHQQAETSKVLALPVQGPAKSLEHIFHAHDFYANVCAKCRGPHALTWPAQPAAHEACHMQCTDAYHLWRR